MTDAADKPLQDDEIDLGKLVGVIWRGKILIAAIALACLLLGGFYAFRVAVPMYPARVTIALLGEQQQVITDIESVFAGGGTDTVSINTEFEVIRSRRVIGQLVDELDLVSDPEFNGALRDLPLRTRIINSLLGRERVAPSPEQARRRVIDAVIGSVSVASIRQSLAFNISITTTSPEKSTRIVNALADLYIADQVRQRIETTESAIGFLSERTAQLEETVEALERDLAAQTEGADVVTPELLQARNLQLSDLRERISELEAGIASDEQTIAVLSNYDSVETLSEILIGTGDVRLEALGQRHRTGRLTDEGLLDAVDAVVAESQEAVVRSQAQIAALRASASDLAAQIRTQTAELSELQQLTREVETARLLYESFFTRLQETAVQQGLETADARVLSEAVPRGASSPNRPMILALSIVLGTMIGIAVVLLREWRFAAFRTGDDLREATGRRVLGTVPSMGTDDRRGTLEHMKAHPNSVFAEAVRNLRTSILMSNIDKEPQVILMTSAIPGEGKTTLSIALTRYLASMEGKRALLFEADIRRKTLRAYVDHEPRFALMDILLAKAPSADIDLYNDELGVEVLAGADTGGNAADLFASRRFADLMEALRGEFDYIVMDAPPVLAVPDARVLATYADAIAFVVKWSVTSKTQVQQGLDMLDSVGADVTGMVLSQVDQQKMKSYGYGGQYGYDGYASKYYSSD